jgi:type VI secretion system protein ImpH
MVKTVSPLERLATEPRRFGFDAAVRVLLSAAHSAEPADVVRFRSVPGLAYPAADVISLQTGDEGAPPDMVVTVMGLTGPTGVLPRNYTANVTTTLRSRSRALYDFLDLLSHRLVALFAKAGTKYRPNRIAETSGLTGGSDDPLTVGLLSLTGYGTSGLTERLPSGISPLLHYAGLFAAHPRSAERLEALVSDWLARPVEVRQFVGAWLRLPSGEQTRLPSPLVPGQFNRLGFDASIGVRAWDVQAGVILRIGPLDRRGFAALLPDGAALGRLVSLVRAYTGFTTSFAINLVVAAAEVPPLQLRVDAAPVPRLGWNTWLSAPAPRLTDVDDALFEAEVIEARVSPPTPSRAGDQTGVLYSDTA